MVRNLDPFQSNSKNTQPGPIMQAPVIMGVDGGDEDEREESKCPYCDKPEHRFADKWGNHIGAGQSLRQNIIGRIENRPWDSGPTRFKLAT